MKDEPRTKVVRHTIYQEPHGPTITRTSANDSVILAKGAVISRLVYAKLQEAMAAAQAASTKAVKAKKAPRKRGASTRKKPVITLAVSPVTFDQMLDAGKDLGIVPTSQNPATEISTPDPTPEISTP